MTKFGKARKNQTVRFAKPKYLVLVVFRAKPRKELKLKI
jgi:hypothetical protein